MRTKAYLDKLCISKMAEIEIPLTNSADSFAVQLEAVINIMCNRDVPLELLQQELFMATVLTIMLEKGFTPILVESDMQSKHNTTKQLKCLHDNWRRADDSYEIKFALKQFRNHTMKLVVSPSGGIMLVNAILTDINNDVFSECIAMSAYIVSPKARTPKQIFQNFHHLKNKLMDKVISPVRSRIITHHGYESASLIGLPQEVLFKILLHLNVKDILNVIKICSQMLWIKNDQVLWRTLLLRDYPEVLNPDAEDTNYLQAYMNRHNIAQSTTIRDNSFPLYCSYNLYPALYTIL